MASAALSSAFPDTFWIDVSQSSMQQRDSCSMAVSERITPLLRELHWLRVPERIKFRLAVPMFRRWNNTAPAYVTKDLQWASDDNCRRRLRSASSYQLTVHTIGDLAFSIAAPRLWNALPPDVISASLQETS